MSIRGPQVGALCKILAIFKLQNFFNWGSKNFFFGGPTPKPEVEFLAEGGGVRRAWGEVSGGEKIFAKLPRVSEIFGVKEKHLAPPSGKT